MADPARKPLAVAPRGATARLPMSIRYNDEERLLFKLAAQSRGIEVSRFIRICSIAGLKVLPAVQDVEAYVRNASAESA
jgi:hypothetical protein